MKVALLSDSEHYASLDLIKLELCKWEKIKFWITEIESNDEKK